MPNYGRRRGQDFEVSNLPPCFESKPTVIQIQGTLKLL